MNKKALACGVIVTELDLHLDDRGYLVELHRNSWRHGVCKQVYLSTTRSGVVKGWHMHEKQIDNVCCVKGEIKLVLYSEKHNILQEIYMGEHRMLSVKIPPGLWHGWRCISACDAMIINAPSEEFDRDAPDEIRRSPHCDIIYMGDRLAPYNWDVVDR